MLATSASDAAQGALNVVIDPCLLNVAGLLNELHKAEAASGGPTQAAPGIGLCKVVKPLEFVVFVRNNPIVGWGMIAGFLGIFVGIGYKIGKRSK